MYVREVWKRCLGHLHRGRHGVNSRTTALNSVAAPVTGRRLESVARTTDASSEDLKHRLCGVAVDDSCGQVDLGLGCVVPWLFCPVGSEHARGHESIHLQIQRDACKEFR